MDYNEVATGTAGGQPQYGLVKVNAQDHPRLSSLPMRPAAPRNMYPSYYSGTRMTEKVDNVESGNSDWMRSEAGQSFLKKHNMQVLPTQLLSQECQRRKFNPSFTVEDLGGNEFRCTAMIKEVAVTCSGDYGSGIAAKMDTARKALEIVRKWPLPPPTLYFLAEFQGQIPEEAVHQKLQDFLKGRRYGLSIQRRFRRGTHGGHILLQLPGQTYTGNTIQVNRDHRCGLRTLVFEKFRQGNCCNLCGVSPAFSHAIINCPRWEKSRPLGMTAMNRPLDSDHGFPQGAINSGQIKKETFFERDTGNVVHNQMDKSDELIRHIQDVTGIPTNACDDPRVKTALLQGFALGARFAGMAPGTAVSRERQRSGSPDRGEQHGSGYGAPRTYRSRSPISSHTSIPSLQWDDRSRARDARSRMIDHGVQSVLDRGLPVAARDYGGHGASHWDNGMTYR
ncbi:hypothetical protein GE09DRAFT_556625 [Coniochaeta sp. 2T2.1]|nr:hypothetical protein GE09DRAFT_556625 [Coniochaeta sp. 2T2.1]